MHLLVPFCVSDCGLQNDNEQGISDGNDGKRGTGVASWPYSCLFALWCVSTPRTHPTPSSCQARQRSLPPVFTQWEQKSCRGFQDKGICGGNISGAAVWWKGMAMVDKEAFMRHLRVLVTGAQEKCFSVCSCSNRGLRNEYVMSKDQLHPPAAQVKGKPEPAAILRWNSSNCCCLRERGNKVGGQDGREGKVGVVEIHIHLR